MSIVVNPMRSHGTSASTAVPVDLLARFFMQVAQTPDHPAIITTEDAWTYQALYVDVVRWKIALNEQHVQGPVVLCLDRHPRMLAIMLALMWLEVAYVPVDATVPAERLRFMIEDSQTQALLYDHPDFHPPAALPCTILNVSQLNRPVLHAYPLVTPALPKKGGLAYIIYTSGSTGKPKGVMIPRVALNNFLASVAKHFLHDQHALLLAATTVAFDIAMLELWLPIWQGRTVLLATHAQHRHPLLLKSLLETFPVTLFQTTPSWWQLLYATGWQGKPDLVALSGGEQLTPALAKQLLTTVGELWNMYGPTEATVWCALKRIQPDEPITVGRAIDNMAMMVLDDAQCKVPPGEKGELYLSGIGLASGYVNASLNHGRFMPAEGGRRERLYRVGDLACETAQGEFVIVGRCDHQIKLHGFRIELEEIEACILTLAGVSACAVAVYQEQLVAYVSLAGCIVMNEAILQAHLRDHLPYYMCPTRVIVLAHLPLTASGKIDRQALPAPVECRHTGKQQVLQESSIVSAVQQIWAAELELAQVAAMDHFFQLGGHSLIAARIVARIGEDLGKQLSMQDFYEAPILVHFAERVEKAPACTHQRFNTPLMPSARAGLSLTDFQLTLWIARRFERRLKIFNVVGRRRIQGPVDLPALNRALNEVMQKHEVLAYRMGRTRAVQLATAYKTLTWHETSLRGDAAEVERQLSAAYNALFFRHTWKRHAPMITATLFHLPQQQLEMQVVFSHFISDERSLDIFFRDLSKAYATTGSREMMPHHAYQTYVQKQTQSIPQAEQITFWRTYLQDAGFCPMPKQVVVKHMARHASALVTRLPLAESVVQGLRAFCLQHQLGINEVIAAAVGSALQRCLADAVPFPPTVVMNMLKSTRDHPLYDQVIGCFLHMHTIKLALHTAQPLLALAQQAQQATLDTSAYQRVPSLVKLASIGQRREKRLPFVRSLLQASGRAIAPLLSQMNIPSIVTQACLNLAAVDRREQFLINLNVLNHFLSPPTYTEQVLGKPTLPMTAHPLPAIPMKSVLDVWLFREQSSREAQLLIAANVLPTFQAQFAKTLIQILVGV